ncbi:MAG: hypothetical protein SGJ00_10860 [bacterium]|nr:hypothetical protein [bacterium]
MPAKEIKALRQAGKLEEALNLAKAEMEAEPANIWPKRNISWVYYDYLKQNSSPEHFDSFISWLDEIKNLQLPVEEKMLFEQLCWQIGKMAFGLLKTIPVDLHKSIRLFESVESFHFPKPSEGYSFLFKSLHKALKETDKYIYFADWWNFKNFMPEDYQKEKMPNGKEVMAVAEQAYIAYAKHLLPKQNQFGEMVFDREKAMAFLPILSNIVDTYPQFQYPAYFNAKLLLALGDKDHMLSALLPFAKKKRNDFWVWEILSEAFSNDPEKVFACYCKALSCKSPEEMLVSLRQKMADLLIAKKLYNEAKTEIDLLVHTRTEHGFRIPIEVMNWQATEWYKNAIASKSNFGFYKVLLTIAEGLLFSDVPEELLIVEFVNTDKKMLNFIVSESKFGFFKYDRFFSEAKVGDILKVRFQGGSKAAMHQIFTAVKVNDEVFKSQFLKEVNGAIKIPAGKPFGFIEDVFIHPSLVSKLKLTDGMLFKGKTIKSFNKEKKEWSWKLI